MGIMDNLINKAASNIIPGASNPLLAAAIQLVSRSGGISGIAGLFESKGLGHVAQSWIGTGPNIPIQEGQIRDLFGQDQLTEVARDSGMQTGELTSQLARFLPNFVNEMTPNGQAPQGQLDMKNMLSIGMRLLNR